MNTPSRIATMATMSKSLYPTRQRGLCADFGAWVTAHPAAARASLAALMGWHRLGRLHPHVGRVLPLAAANEGLAMLRDRSATGKIVVRV